jgi:hypothetical protein
MVTGPSPAATDFLKKQQSSCKLVALSFIVPTSQINENNFHLLRKFVCMDASLH